MDIHLQLSFAASPPDVPESFLIEYVAEIVESDTSETIGKARVFVLHAERCRDYGYNPFYVLDTLESSVVYTDLLSYEHSGNFAPAVLKILKEDWVESQDMLILDRLEISPSHRGHGYGLQTMHLLLMHLSAGCRIAALKPYPLQFEPRAQWDPAMDLGAFKMGKREATAKLKSQYARLGFRSAGRTGLMIRDLADGYSLRWEEVATDAPAGS